MIRRLLVANRGEIARRVFATCRRLGIETVAVFSDADAGLPFVHEADVAFRLPGSAPADTYLRGDLVVEAARRTGADAVHPGYGFLSESAAFARAVIDAGRTWVGPSPESIAAMGSKVGAKRLMVAAGVPVLTAPADPSEGDLPLLVKASAGGGGRGMRIVRSLVDLPGEIETASAEAASAFGDGTVFVEPYVEHGRHVEVQVVGDHHGDVLVLGERDCSIQRRHQKVVEEAPAPDIDGAVVAAMQEAARAAAAAIGYVGAGTVEFLYDPARERFSFLEMNTRLQVEHPVTEAVFDIDLVELQLAVAEGRALGSVVEPPGSPRGHAIEVRLYAEDPVRDWQPQSGRLVTFDIPHDASFEPGSVRVDAGVASGSEVSTHYDAMLAKVIAWAPTRHEAARRLAGALSRARIHGVTTNRDLLVATLRDPAFLAGEVGTDFFDRRPVVHEPGSPSPQLLLAATILLAEDDRRKRRVQQGIPVGWRNVTSQPQRTVLLDGDTEHLVEWLGTREGYSAGDTRVLDASVARVVLETGGVSAPYEGVVVAAPDGTREVHVDGPGMSASLQERPRFADPAEQVRAGTLVAPMPGTVVSVAVRVGDRVEQGQAMLVLEAMKMQHTVTAPTSGVVTEIDVESGGQVAAGAVLVVVEGDEG